MRNKKLFALLFAGVFMTSSVVHAAQLDPAISSAVFEQSESVEDTKEDSQINSDSSAEQNTPVQSEVMEENAGETPSQTESPDLSEKEPQTEVDGMIGIEQNTDDSETDDVKTDAPENEGADAGTSEEDTIVVPETENKEDTDNDLVDVSVETVAGAEEIPAKFMDQLDGINLLKITTKYEDGTEGYVSLLKSSDEKGTKITYEYTDIEEYEEPSEEQEETVTEDEQEKVLKSIRRHYVIKFYEETLEETKGEEQVQKNTAKDTEEVSEEITADSTKEATEEVAADYTEEATEESAVNSTEETSTETIAENTQGTTEETTTEETEQVDAIEEIVEANPQMESDSIINEKPVKVVEYDVEFPVNPSETIEEKYNLTFQVTEAKNWRLFKMTPMATTQYEFSASKNANISLVLDDGESHEKYAISDAFVLNAETTYTVLMVYDMSEYYKDLNEH